MYGRGGFSSGGDDDGEGGGKKAADASDADMASQTRLHEPSKAQAEADNLSKSDHISKSDIEALLAGARCGAVGIYHCVSNLQQQTRYQ